MKVNISWAFAGNAIYAGCQWVVFVLLLRSLPLAEVGEFAYGIAVAGPVFVLANMRLRNLVATDVSSPGGFHDYLSTRLLTTAVAVCAVLLIGVVLPTDVASLGVLGLIASAKGCDAISDICHGLFQRELEMRTAAIGLMANGLLSAGLVAMSLVVWPSLSLAAGAYAAASLLALVGWDLPRMRSLAVAAARPRTAMSTLRAAQTLIWRAAPLGLSSAVGSVRANLPRYVVTAYLGPAALAVFTALAYIPTLGNLIANAVAQAALPVLTRDLRSADGVYGRRLRSLVQSGILLGAVSVLATALVGRFVLAAIYGPGVAQHLDVLLWLMTAAAMSYAFLFLGTASTARMRFGAQLLISAAALITVAGSVVPLVSWYGLLGGAYALCAGALVEGCAYAALTVHDFRTDARLRGIDRGVMAAACGQ
jgi:O-antigen/teichoic acid export membrane protein